MENTEYFMTQLDAAFSDISHPIEGILLLSLLAVIIRWRWPIVWNNFLKSISAPTEKKIK